MPLFGRRKRDQSQSAPTESERGQPGARDELLDGPATLYRTKYLTVVPAGDEVLLHDAERDNPVAIPGYELDLLMQCSYFAPVEEHASAAAARTGLPADSVALRLYEMVERGLLLSKQEVMTRARATVGADSESELTLDRVAILTSDRPNSLANCVGSYRERYGADVEIIAFDDSADPVIRAENRRAVKEVGAGERILYAGADEKREFVAKLVSRSGVDEQVVRDAITEFHGYNWHTGANRNAALLDSAGDAVLMVDDDTTARAVSVGDLAPGFRLSSRGDPWSYYFFSDSDEALAAADWQDVDLLAWHRRFLGKSPSACAFAATAEIAPASVDTESTELDLNHADATLVDVFVKGRGRVAATSIGLAGDSGMGVPINFLWLQGPERERLLENYESFRATRGVHRCAEVTTVSASGFLMTPNVAFDVRGIIPPFPPALRNEDGAFGRMLRAIAPESYIAYLPWAVEHIPAAARKVDFAEFRQSIARVHSNTIVVNLADTFEPAPGVTDPAVRLSAFGRYLIALGSMRPTDFDAFARHQITVTVSQRIEALTRSLDHFGGQPEFWAEDCSEIAKEGIRALAEDEILVDDQPGTSPEESRRLLQRYIYRFGRIVEAWPALLAAARGLRVASPA